MDKAIEKIIDSFPLPILAVVALIYGIGWLLKELRPLATWGEVIKDRAFRRLALLLFAVALICYGGVFLIRLFPRSEFLDTERGVSVAQFDYDQEGIIQAHTCEDLQSAIHGIGLLADVRIARLDRKLGSDQEAQEFCRSINAKICIWGTFVPPRLLHIRVCTSSEPYVAYFNIEDYTSLTQVEEYVLTQLKSIPPARESPSMRAELLEREVKELRDSTLRMKAQIDRLNYRIQNLSLERPADSSTSAPLALITMSESKRRRLALIVGVSNYESMPRLAFPAIDAKEMNNAIRTLWPENSQTYLLTDAEATKTNIEHAMAELEANAQTDDQLWLYWGGHSLFQNEEAYLIPYDGDANSLRASSISASQIRGWFDSPKFEQGVMFVDACYAASFGPVHMTRGVSISRDYHSLFKRAKGKVFIMASTQNEVAFEGYKVGHGMFSYGVLLGLSGQGDIDNDGLITSDELFRSVQETVMRFGLNQHPTYVSPNPANLVLGLSGKYIFHH